MSPPVGAGERDTGSRKQAQRVAGGALVALAGGGLSFVLATVYQVAIARRLGVGGFGLFILALAVSNLIAEGCDLGLDFGVLRFGGIAHGSGDTGRFRSVVTRGLSGAFSAGAVAGGLLALGSALVAGLFGKAELTPVLFPLALAVPFTAATEVARAALRAMGKALPSVLSDSVFAPAIRLMTGLWATAVAASPRAVAVGYLTTEAIVWLLTLAMLWRLAPRGRSTGPVQGLFRFSLAMSLNRVIIYSNNQTEVAVLGFLAPTLTLGVFGAARRMSILIGSLLTSITVLFNPLVADLHHRERLSDLDELFKTSTRWLFTLGLPVCLVEVLFSRDIMRVFGPGFEAGAVPLVILAVGQLVNVGTGTVAAVLAMAGRAKITLFNSVLFLVFSISLDLLLIPPYGLIGAAVANSSAVVAVNVLRVYQVRRAVAVSPYDRRFLRPVVAGLIAGLFAHVLPLSGVPDMAQFALRVIGLGVVYFAMLCLLGFEEVDREISRSVLDRLRTRRVRRGSEPVTSR